MTRLYTLLALLLLTSPITGRLLSQCAFTPIDVSGETCLTSRFLCGAELDNLAGTLSTGDTPGVQPLNYCGSSSAENIEWYSFLVDDTSVELQINFSGCSGGVLLDQGFQAGVYSGCDFATDDLICESQSVTSGTITLSFSTVPGIHYMFLDGFAGSVCDFEVDVVTGVCIDPFEVLNPPSADCHPVDNDRPDQDTVTICRGNRQMIRPDLDFPPIWGYCDIATGAFSNMIQGQPMYCIETVISGSTGYTIDSGEEVQVTYTGPRSTILSANTTIHWDTEGTYTVSQNISANPYLPACLNYDPTCGGELVVIVVPYDTITLPTDTICQGNTYSFCNQTVSSSDTIACDDRDNCEVTVQPVFVLPRETIQLGTVYVCSDSCYQVRGTTYCSLGSHSDSGITFCDTIITFELEEIDLTPTVTGDTILSCSKPTITLTGNTATTAPVQLSSYWTDASNTVISNMPTVEISQPGTYTYHGVADGHGCEATTEVLVIRDNIIPNAMITAPLLSCDITNGPIQVTSSANVSGYSWSGPNSFQSVLASPTVSDTGRYDLIITAANGCMLDTFVIVSGDFAVPDLSLTYDDIDCSSDLAAASYLSETAISGLWTMPDGTTSTDPSITYDISGLYKLTLTGPSGCEADSTFEVLDLWYEPTVEMHRDTLWRCNTSLIAYDYNTPTIYDVTWATIDGDFIETATGMTATSIGTYIATIYDNSTSCVGYDTLLISTDTSSLEALWTVTEPTCHGDSDGHIVVDVLQGEAPYTITVDGSAMQLDAMQGFGAGNYSILLQDGYGCTVDTNLTIESPSEVWITTDPTITVRNEPETTLEVEHTVPDERLSSITWVDSEGNTLSTSHTLTIKGTPANSYGVSVKDINGCADSISLSIIIDSSIEIWAPSVFNPEGADSNQIWFLSSNARTDALINLQIYSRWGDLVYNEDDISFGDAQKGWDGTYRGSIMAPGVYVYKVSYTDFSGQLRTTVGSLTLLR